MPPVLPSLLAICAPSAELTLKIDAFQSKFPTPRDLECVHDMLHGLHFIHNVISVESVLRYAGMLGVRADHLII